MTATDVGHPWMLVDWNVIQPGDVVQDPRGREWSVAVRLEVGDLPLAFRLECDDAQAWTERERDEKVLAWRFSREPGRGVDELMAIGRLRLAGFDVKEIR